MSEAVTVAELPVEQGGFAGSVSVETTHLGQIRIVIDQRQQLISRIRFESFNYNIQLLMVGIALHVILEADLASSIGKNAFVRHGLANGKVKDVGAVPVRAGFCYHGRGDGDGEGGRQEAI